MKRLLLAAALFPAFAFAGGSVTVSHPWFRYLLPQVPAGGYLVLRNASGTPAILTGASSPACGSLMLHHSVHESGMDMMKGVKSITVPPRGSFAFSEGGYHLMCVKPKMTVGKKVPVTLDFADGMKLRAEFTVSGPQGPK